MLLYFRLKERRGHYSIGKQHSTQNRIATRKALANVLCCDSNSIIKGIKGLKRVRLLSPSKAKWSSNLRDSSKFDVSQSSYRSYRMTWPTLRKYLRTSGRLVQKNFGQCDFFSVNGRRADLSNDPDVLLFTQRTSIIFIWSQSIPWPVICVCGRYSRDPNKSDAPNRSDGWKNRQNLNKSDAPNKSDAWKTESLPVKICFPKNSQITKNINAKKE